MNTTASQQSTPPQSSQVTRPSQRDLVVASLLAGHGTPIKRPSHRQVIL